jgi:hypothetical protein
MGQPAQFDFERNRHLLLDFLGGVSGEQCDHRDLNVRDVRKRFDGQGFERNNSATDEKNRHQDQKKRLMEGKGDNTPNHGGSAFPVGLKQGRPGQRCTALELRPRSHFLFLTIFYNPVKRFRLRLRKARPHLRRGLNSTADPR